MDCNKNLEGEIILFWKWKEKNGLGKKNIGICKGGNWNAWGKMEYVRKNWNVQWKNGTSPQKFLNHQQNQTEPKKITQSSKSQSKKKHPNI